MWGKKIPHVGSQEIQVPGFTLRIVIFCSAEVVRCHAENWISYSKNPFLNSESCFENTLGTLWELWKWRGRQRDIWRERKKDWFLYLVTTLVTQIAATSKSQIASDCNRNSKKSLRLRKHPLKPTLWTRELQVLCGFYSVSQAPHGSGNPPEYVATTRVWFWIAAIFLAQCDFCDCDTAILLRFLREKFATSKLWLPIASDLWLRLRGSLRWQRSVSFG